LLKYKMVGLARRTSKEVYVHKGEGHTSIASAISWARRKGADTILILFLDE